MQGKSVLETPVQYVPTVGPARARLLSRLDIRSVEELLYTAPRRYEDRSQFTPMDQLAPGVAQTVLGTIERVEGRRARRGLALVEIVLHDASGSLRAIWFNQPYLAKQFVIGQSVLLYGKVEGQTSPQMLSPEFELVHAEERDAIHMGCIVPVYSTTAALSQRRLRQMVHEALGRFSYRLVDPLPAELRLKHELIDLPTALRTLHFPPDWASVERAHRRLAFDECLTLQLLLALRRRTVTHTRKPQRPDVNGPLTAAFLKRLPFALTAGQQQVLAELRADVSRPQPMNRLLQGEVGSGKTVLATWLLLVAVQSGYQAALMAPTEILAEQHSRTLKALVGPLGVTIALVSRGVRRHHRQAAYRRITRGEPLIVIGTHALLQQAVRFEHLALVVIDEQHKFGVAQRARLRAKGHTPDVLVMTATPIPRTLAMTVYGDLDISTLKELPPGRQPLQTQWLRSDARALLHERLHATLASGQQAYVVYPLIDETATSDLKAATRMARELQAVLPQCRVGLLHGKLPSEQKQRLMRHFVQRTIHVLVSTIIIEVGIDVPNATLMVIEHAERFGLAQLHQLRGRIGRGSAPATCLIFSDTQAPEAVARLQAFVELRDGFALAERDLALRGPGEALGTQQHGLPALRFANLLTDLSTLQAAREEAQALVESAAHPSRPQALRRLADRLLAKYQHIDLA